MTRGSGRKLPPRPVDPMVVLRRVMSAPAIERLARDVITRLSARTNSEWTAPEDEVQRLCMALTARYPYDAKRQIDQLLEAGVSIDRIYGGYLAEAARRLGDLWERDSVSFEQVSVASTRIYLIVDDLRRRMPPVLKTNRPSLAFAAVPGEMHTLGVEMATELFRQHGWDVTHLIDKTHDQIVEAAEDTDIVLIGLSASGRRRRAALLRLVVALRVVRPDLKILLSGAIADAEPALISQIGIDAIVKDVPEALRAVSDLTGVTRDRVDRPD